MTITRIMGLYTPASDFGGPTVASDAATRGGEDTKDDTTSARKSVQAELDGARWMSANMQATSAGKKGVR